MNNTHYYNACTRSVRYLYNMYNIAVQREKSFWINSLGTIKKRCREKLYCAFHCKTIQYWNGGSLRDIIIHRRSNHSCNTLKRNRLVGLMFASIQTREFKCLDLRLRHWSSTHPQVTPCKFFFTGLCEKISVPRMPQHVEQLKTRYAAEFQSVTTDNTSEGVWNELECCVGYCENYSWNGEPHA